MARTVREIEAEIRSLAAADRDRLLRDLLADLDGTRHYNGPPFLLEQDSR